MAEFTGMLAEAGKASVYRKQTRHCWLTRMLYWPARCPASFSSRFPAEHAH